MIDPLDWWWLCCSTLYNICVWQRRILQHIICGAKHQHKHHQVFIGNPPHTHTHAHTSKHTHPPSPHPPTPNTPHKIPCCYCFWVSLVMVLSMCFPHLPIVIHTTGLWTCGNTPATDDHRPRHHTCIKQRYCVLCVCVCVCRWWCGETRHVGV